MADVFTPTEQEATASAPPVTPTQTPKGLAAKKKKKRKKIIKTIVTLVIIALVITGGYIGFKALFKEEDTSQILTEFLPAAASQAP